MGDKVSGQPVDFLSNTARAVLGQGLGMGWGDEAEAWLRSKLSNESYETALPRIRSEYGQYAKQYPLLKACLSLLAVLLLGLV